MLLRTLIVATLATGLAAGYADAAKVGGGRNNNNNSAVQNQGNKSEFCPGDVSGDIPKGFSQCEAGHEMGGAYIAPNMRRHYNAY